MTRTSTRAAAALLLLALVTGCGSGETPRGTSPTTPVVSTLTPLPPPSTAAPTGRLYADLRQSSRDAALGRMQVWIANDTTHDVTPTRIRYTDPRFRRPVTGERLRMDPARSERGYPLTLPLQPACGQRGTRGTVAVTAAGRTVDLRVADDNDIVQRYVAARCLALAVARVADLRFSDDVAVDRPGAGSTAVLTLVARPTGSPGHLLTIDTVGGTPLLGAVGGDVWRPRARVTGAGRPQRIELPVQPSRCDDHVFMESAGATAFLVTLHLDGRPGRLVLRMSPAGASRAIAFARDSCGL